MAPDSPATKTVRGSTVYVRRFQVDVLDGPDRGASAVSTDDELTIGTAEGVGLRLSDPSISRHHCALKVTERGLELRDLGSTNGTYVGDVEVVRGFVRSGARIRAGTSLLGITVLRDQIAHELATDDRFGELIGASPAMRRLYPVLEKCARSDVTVLLHGETGTGKELVAEAIHLASPRRDRPFVVCNCTTLAPTLLESELFGHVRGAFTGADRDRKGLFEAAHGGTIFLDEIGELPIAVQVKLLRVLENREIKRIGSPDPLHIEIRVIAATIRDLAEMVRQNTFRDDLFYRLNVGAVYLPPLRTRTDDIEPLVHHFIEIFNQRLGRTVSGPTPQVLDIFARYPWPGNVRELANVIERSMVVCRGTLILPENLPPHLFEVRAPVASDEPEMPDLTLQAAEREQILRALQASGGKRVEAARRLGLSRRTLYRKLSRYGIS